MQKLRLLFLLLLPALSLAAQGKDVTIDLHPVFNGKPLAAGHSYFNPGTRDSVRIDRLSFYVSAVTFLWHDSVVMREENSFHLVDLEDTATLRIHCKLTKPFFRYDRVRFQLGIDSVTNVSGALGGDLDPTKGMYWTWQSGYVNFKLEGTSPQCPTRNHRFQYHLGGYAAPNASVQTVSVACPQGGKQINLSMDIGVFLRGIDLAKENEIMSPGAAAVRMAKLLPAIFALLP